MFVCLLIAILSAVLYTSIAYNSLNKHYITEKKLELKRKTTIISNEISLTGYFIGLNREKINYNIDNFSKDSSARVLLLDADGVVVYDTLNEDLGKVFATPEILECLQGIDKEYELKNEKKINIIKSIKSYTKTNVIGVMFVSSSTQKIYDRLMDLYKKFSYILVIITVFVVILSIYLSGIIYDPLKQLLINIKRITNGHLDEKIKLRDKSEFAQIANSINHMTERLREIDENRKEFVSNVSHELKTPLSSIKVLTESLLLQENAPEEMYKEFLMDINSEIDRQTAIINDLLTLVKLDDKGKALNIKKVNINEMIEQILKRLHPLADRNNIDLILDLRREVIAEVDEMKFTLAISNIIENGIKYNKKNGRIVVVVDANYNNAIIKIIDTGIGIPEKHFDKIFQRFYRVDKARNRETGGTGLGLSIAHRIVLLHKGSIDIKSKKEEGSTFTVIVPLI